MGGRVEELAIGGCDVFENGNRITCDTCEDWAPAKPGFCDDSDDGSSSGCISNAFS